MESFTVPFQLATDFINKTSRAVFLTGKAGTGKTTFLREIRQHTHKQTAVVAPTGVAAINAGGSTIHSFFQLPFSPYLPDKKSGQLTNAVSGKSELIARVKLNTKRRKVLQELELLIIDEISMVRCDTLDAIDVILRHVRYRPNEPFGGVQLLLIGDMFQLSPVAVEHEWYQLSQFYSSRYFFHSRVMMQQPPIYIELDKIYRQKNEDFIKVLNEVRNNNLSPAGYALLQNRYDPEFIPSKQDNYITLSTHNSIADKINAKALLEVPNKSVVFKATVKGEYPENMYPLDISLELKVGAKVMFVKNDLEAEKRYYNGKIGTIISFDTESIEIQCPNEPFSIIVSPYIWENVRYEIDPVTQLLNEHVIGTFQQFPLRLAWAITIHKSQGLTFEKAIIDAGKAFAPGQVYVALSRCTSLEGLVLMSPIQAGSLSNDQHIVNHSKSKLEVEETEKFLIKEKQQFHRLLLTQIFDFEAVSSILNDLYRFYQAKPESFNAETEFFIKQLISKVAQSQLTAQKFQTQIHSLLSASDLPEHNLQNRIAAGSAYFEGIISELLEIIRQCKSQTDSKVQAQILNDSLKELFTVLSQKQHLMMGIKKTFSVEEYYKVRKSFAIPPFNVNCYSGSNNATIATAEVAHPKLFQRLRILRNELCEAKQIPVYLVAGSATLEELVKFLPLTLTDLEKITGFGETKIQAFGQQFLDVIIDYCKENKLLTLIGSKPAKRKRNGKDSKLAGPMVSTKLVSFQYYNSGSTIEQIASIRGLTTGTIFNHLAQFAVSGELNPENLVQPQKIKLIEAALISTPNHDLNSLKQKLDPEISFDEIRLVSMLYNHRK